MTTKTGSYNERASVTVRSQYGMSTLAYLIAAGDSPMRNTMTFGLGYSF